MGFSWSAVGHCQRATKTWGWTAILTPSRLLSRSGRRSIIGNPKDLRETLVNLGLPSANFRAPKSNFSYRCFDGPSHGGLWDIRCFLRKKKSGIVLVAMAQFGEGGEDGQHCEDAFFPQIAGSYRGSYFSMTGLLIPKIAKWS